MDKLVKTALDELRMQMLGAQVLFGFQFHGAFQDAFRDLSKAGRLAHAVAFGLVLITFAILVSVPSQHRIVEGGKDTRRIFHTATAYAAAALLPFAIAIGADIFVVSEHQLGTAGAVATASLLSGLALIAFYGFGRVVEKSELPPMQKDSPTPLHAKIDQLLTEARVILPGAQALLGFQFVVMLTQAFGELPSGVRIVHLAGLLAVAFSIILLLTPAAMHRIAFGGRDVSQFHKIGSMIVTIALAPLAAGITADLYVATIRIFGSGAIALGAALGALTLLIGFWYLLPLAMRMAR
jgi:hypothetical protein